MIRTLAAIATIATIATGCHMEPVSVTIVKTIHPDGTATCALFIKEGHPDQQMYQCPPEDMQNYVTKTVTATPTP